MSGYTIGNGRYNPTQHRQLEKEVNEADKRYRYWKRRCSFLYAITLSFLSLLMLGIVAGFTINLGNGIIGTNIFLIVCFFVSAFFSGLWTFEGWDRGYEEALEGSQEALEKYLNDTAETRFSPPDKDVSNVRRQEGTQS